VKREFPETPEEIRLDRDTTRAGRQCAICVTVSPRIASFSSRNFVSPLAGLLASPTSTPTLRMTSTA
jgi:hypothetical protein